MESLYPMRINKYLAWKKISTRRGADELIQNKKVFINGKLAVLGDKIKETDKVEIKGAKAKEYFRSQLPIIDVDGVRIEFPDGWALIRASNTQPVLVLRFEASSEPRLKAIRAFVEESLNKL